MYDRQHVRTLGAIWSVVLVLVVIAGLVNAIRLDAQHHAHDQLVVACAAVPAGSYTPHQCEGLNP